MAKQLKQPSGAYRQELNRYVAKFGQENGIKWFTAGLSYVDALSNHIDVLKAEVAAKEQEVAEKTEKLALFHSLGMVDETGELTAEEKQNRRLALHRPPRR